jgi:hypothetical protein
MKVISNKYTFPDDFERGIHKGTTSTVWISKDKMYVIKFVVKYDDYDVFNGYKLKQLYKALSQL